MMETTNSNYRTQIFTEDIPIHIAYYTVETELLICECTFHFCNCFKELLPIFPAALRTAFTRSAVYTVM